MVHGDFVRAHEKPFAKAFDELAGRIELEDRVEGRAGAVGAARAERAAAINGPDLSIETDGNAGSGVLFSAARELAPAHSREIGVGEIVASAERRDRGRLRDLSWRACRRRGGLREGGVSMGCIGTQNGSLLVALGA